MHSRAPALSQSGVPRSTAAYEKALRQFQCYRGNPIATIDAELADDPQFVGGHILRAHVWISTWEGTAVPEVRKSLERLEALAGGASELERSHIAALVAWTDGDWERYRVRLDHLLTEHPCDALALQAGHLADFYHGDRENLRGRVARVLPFWSREAPGYGFLLGMQAFGFEECGDYRRAEDMGRRALELEPDDCWAHHAVAHVMEMETRQSEGIVWMQSRENHWAQADNAFAFHNWWHSALYHLDLGDIERVLEIYDSRLSPDDGALQLRLLDGAALLWRLHLQKIDVGARWARLADLYEHAAEDGFYVFNDMHAMMSYVAAGRFARARQLLAAIEQAARSTGTNAAMTVTAGLNIARAIEAFGRERYDTAVELLLPVRYRAHAFGGSHAQRDVVHRTLLEAALRDGRQALARALAAERVALRPHCPFSWRLRARVEPGAATSVS